MQFRALAPIAFVVLGACSDANNELGYRHSNPDYMRELAAQLRTGGVEFQVREDGMLRYKVRDEVKVKAISAQVEIEVLGGDMIKFEKEEERRMFISLLESSNMKYRLETRTDGVWVRWYPKTIAEGRELPARVLEQSIASRNTVTEPCPPLTPAGKSPSNTPAQADRLQRCALPASAGRDR